MQVGGQMCGNVSLDGEIVGLEVVVSNGGSARVTWAHEGVDGLETGHRLALVVDGEVAQLMAAGTVEARLEGLGVGEHRVEVRTVRPETAVVPDFHGWGRGRQAWLRWGASEAEDVAGYAVYSDGGSGTVDLVTPVAVVAAGTEEWESGELALGTHLFRVAARDEAGNEGTPSGVVSVAIIGEPEGVSGLAAAWDGTEVTLSWTLPEEEPSAVRVYSNGSNAFGILRERVIEEWPWVELAGDATGHVFTPVVAGVWRFVVRVVDGDGRESESAEVVTVDTSGPASGVALNEPGAVEAVAGPGGTAVVSWIYPVAGGEDCTEFAVYVHESSVPTFVAAADTVSAGTLSGAWVAYNWTSGVLAGERWFTVRARDGEGNETVNTGVVSVVPDAVAPGALEGLAGVAN